VTLGVLPADQASARGGLRRGAPEGAGDLLDGVEVADVDNRSRRQLDLPAGTQGALVTNVDPGSPAYAAGLRPGDVILDINRKPVSNADEAIRLSEQLEGESVLMRVWSRGGTRFIVVNRSRLRR
jgi:serine protease Do